MAKRLYDTEVWRKHWFRMLSPEYKCFWNYLLSNCNLIGIWEVDFELASFQIGVDIEKKAAANLFSDQILILEGGDKWFIKGFVKFQYGESLNEKSPVHRKVIDSLKNLKYKNHTLYDTLYNRVLDTGEDKDKEEDKEEEEEKDKDKDKDKEEEKDSEVFEIEVSPTFEEFWDEYDKKVGEKGKLKKKWGSLKQAEKEAIMEYIPNYKAYQPDKQYRKNPETFLNNKSWNDEIINGTTKNQHRSTSGANQNPAEIYRMYADAASQKQH